MKHYADVLLTSSFACLNSLISHNPLQETLSLQMCVQSIMALGWCAIQCLWWAMASMEMYCLRVKNTAGWDLSDMTTQVWIDFS